MPYLRHRTSPVAHLYRRGRSDRGRLLNIVWAGAGEAQRPVYRGSERRAAADAVCRIRTWPLGGEKCYLWALGNCWSMCPMRRSIIWLIVGASLSLVAVAAGAAAAVPTIRHMVSGLWNVPDRLPALPDDKQVHYQTGAEQYARDVAALLPNAISRIESAHGRPFTHPVTVGVYATPEAYAAANGQGSPAPVGVTFAGRVNLSPRLSGPQHQRLPAILTHELSHAHIQGWIGALAYIHLPNWFGEGLAVMVSGGGGSAGRNSTRGANSRR
jgi:hypothetical protein